MPRPITSEETRRLVAEEDAVLVEVLPEHEYQELHLAGAINIPLKKLTSEAVSDLARTRPVIVYCYDYL